MTDNRYQPLRDEYAGLASSYDQRWRGYNEAAARRTIQGFTLRPGERLLDVACGTGVLLAQVREAFPEAQLSGMDISEAMLAVAVQRLGSMASLQLGNAESLPFQDQSFDVLVMSSALHYLHEPMSALSEFHRVLRVGGRLVITDWCGDFLLDRIRDRWMRLLDDAHVRTWRAEDLQEALRALTFREVKIQKFHIGWRWGMMTAGAVR